MSVPELVRQHQVAAQPAVQKPAFREVCELGQLGDATRDHEDGGLVLVPEQSIRVFLREAAQGRVVHNIHWSSVQA